MQILLHLLRDLLPNLRKCQQLFTSLAPIYIKGQVIGFFLEILIFGIGKESANTFTGVYFEGTTVCFLIRGATADEVLVSPSGEELLAGLLSLKRVFYFYVFFGFGKNLRSKLNPILYGFTRITFNYEVEMVIDQSISHYRLQKMCIQLRFRLRVLKQHSQRPNYKPTREHVCIQRRIPCRNQIMIRKCRWCLKHTLLVFVKLLSSVYFLFKR